MTANTRADLAAEQVRIKARLDRLWAMAEADRITVSEYHAIRDLCLVRTRELAHRADLLEQIDYLADQGTDERWAEFAARRTAEITTWLAQCERADTETLAFMQADAADAMAEEGTTP